MMTMERYAPESVWGSVLSSIDHSIGHIIIHQHHGDRAHGEWTGKRVEHNNFLVSGSYCDLFSICHYDFSSALLSVALGPLFSSFFEDEETQNMHAIQSIYWLVHTVSYAHHNWSLLSVNYIVIDCDHEICTVIMSVRARTRISECLL